MLELRPDVRGINLDFQTRCAHYNSPLEIIVMDEALRASLCLQGLP
jgi:uncharacterized CHY-type Zn-finger protein